MAGEQTHDNNTPTDSGAVDNSSNNGTENLEMETGLHSNPEGESTKTEDDTEEKTGLYSGDEENSEKGEGEGKEKAEGEEKGEAPDEYEIPEMEGFKVEDVPELEDFKTLAKKHGMSQESFNEALELYKKSITAAMTNANDNFVTEAKQAYVDRLKKYGEERKTGLYGGKDYEGNLKRAQSVIAKYTKDTGSTDLKEFLNDPGMIAGDHPATFRLLNWVADQIGDDQRLKGTDPVKKEKPEDTLYPGL